MPYENNSATSYLDLEDEDIAVTNLLNKYNLTVESTYIYSLNDDYNALINYISELNIENQNIPKDIIYELNNNRNFKKFLLKAIQIKMQNILFDRRTIVFKEIVTIINLLSLGKNYQIFNSYNSYDIENLSKLFRYYEEELEKTQENIEEFDLLFEYYIILIESLNELCTINSMDVQRKKTINQILEALSESINITKFKIPLDTHKINRLNNILGKFLFYFSHIPYIEIKNKDVKYLIEEFAFNFEKLSDGYELSKNTNFGEEKESEKYYKKYLNSVTTLLLTLIYKLETYYENEEFNDIKKFNKILEHYENIITHTSISSFKDIKEFKNQLLKNYLFIHGDSINKNPISIIDNFFKTNTFDSSNIHIIYSIILFADDIEDKKLEEILIQLLNGEKFTNDYLEFYKLDICDVIINKLTKNKSSIIKDSLVEIIVSYIEKNKIASHLISIYSKIYLSLSLYFSAYKDLDSNTLAKKYYFIYKKINGDKLLNNEYQLINNNILKNLGFYLVSDLDINIKEIRDEHYLELGKKTIAKYLEREEINQKYNINQTLSNIVTKIFTDEGLNDDALNGYIEEFIAKNIFHGLIFTAVDGLCQHKCRLIDIGYEKLEIPLMEGYKLRIAYSTVYKDIFEHIYNENKEYIKQNVINLIISYLKSIPLYKDKTTLLFNIDKLQKDLKQLNDEEFIFIEFYNNSLEPLNLKYGYSRTNMMFQEFAQKVNELTPTYRVSGPKLGLMLPLDSDYKTMINKIKEISILMDNKKIDFELTFAVSWGNKENILLKSAHSIILALRNATKYNEFK